MKTASLLLESLLLGRRTGLLFDGVDDYVQLTSQPNFSAGFTIMGWVQCTSDPGTNRNIFNNNQAFVRVAWGEANDLEFFVKNAANVLYTRCETNETFPLGVPVHFAATWDLAQIKLYQNGVLKATQTAASGITATTVSARIGLGEQTGTTSNPWLGTIDDMQFWKRALTAQEIATSYARGEPSNYFGLVSRLGFDEGSGSIAYDMLGVNNGSIVGPTFNTFNPYPGNERQLLMADLYTITLQNGTIVRWTSADTALSYGGNTFTLGPKLKREKIKIMRGLQVDTLTVTMYPSDTDMINSVPILQLLHNGGFDGARLLLQRVFMPWWGNTTPGAITLFSGRVSTSPFSRSEAQLVIKSDLELLNVALPRNLYQPTCLNTVFDAGCTLVKASYTSPGTVDSGSTKTQIIDAGFVDAAGYYSLGVLIFTSGQNNGAKCWIRQYTVGNFYLATPLLYTPAPGDTFTVRPGCDRLLDTCDTKFNNKINFRGTPFVPVPESAI